MGFAAVLPLSGSDIEGCEWLLIGKSFSETGIENWDGRTEETGGGRTPKAVGSIAGVARTNGEQTEVCRRLVKGFYTNCMSRA